MPRIKVVIDYIIAPNEHTGNKQITVNWLEVAGRAVRSYQPKLEPDPTLRVWDILGTDNEALTIELRGI